MSLNCNEINKILSELNFEDSFIQEIIQPGFDTLCFRVINKGTLENFLICTSSQATRINLTKYKAPKNEKPLRFNQFLKSRVQGMRINSIEQLGLDRIIKIDVSTWKEKLFIYIRLWSNAANVLVTDENGTILDCMFRRPKKGEVTGGTFIPENKTITEEEKINSIERFPIRDFSDIEWTDEQKNFSFNEKIDFYYSEHAKVLSRESLLEQAEKWYNIKHSKMEAALEKLEQKKKDFENSSNLKHTGDLILSFGNQAEGNTLTCIDYDTQKEVHIRIDAKKSIQENAAIYYEQYKKSLSGLKALEHDIELSKNAIFELDKEYNNMICQKNVLKIEQLLRHDTKPKQQEEKNHPGLRYEIESWTIIVGRTATENDELLRHYVKGQDIWLHTRDYAGGYVFIKGKKDKTVPLEILLYAGNLAVYHSKARKNKEADLYYTQVKHLRRAKNGSKGLVLPTQEKNLFIKIDDEKIRKLDEFLIH